MEIMNVREEFNKIIDIGIPISKVAKRIGRDSSTLNKWYHEKTNISEETEQAIIVFMIDLKKQMNDFMR